MKQRRQAAFTLIEVLVAVAVFGLMSVLASSLLGQTLTSAEMLTERMQRLQAVQRSMRYLSTDLMQTSPRPVRLELGESFEPALQTDLGTEFALVVTHGGWGNPVGLPRGTQQRSAYRLEDGELVRYHWNNLDRAFGTEPIATVLLDEVESLLFRYLDDTGDWTETWPPQDAQGVSALRLRPRAVEIVLTLEGEGELSRIVEVAP